MRLALEIHAARMRLAASRRRLTEARKSGKPERVAAFWESIRIDNGIMRGQIHPDAQRSKGVR